MNFTQTAIFEYCQTPEAAHAYDLAKYGVLSFTSPVFDRLDKSYADCVNRWPLRLELLLLYGPVCCFVILRARSIYRQPQGAPKSERPIEVWLVRSVVIAGLAMILVVIAGAGYLQTMLKLNAERYARQDAVKPPAPTNPPASAVGATAASTAPTASPLTSSTQPVPLPLTRAEVDAAIAKLQYSDVMPKLKPTLLHVFGSKLDDFNAHSDGATSLSIKDNVMFFFGCSISAKCSRSAAFCLDLSSGKAAGAIVDDYVYTYLGDYQSEAALPDSLKEFLKQNSENAPETASPAVKTGDVTTNKDGTRAQQPEDNDSTLFYIFLHLHSGTVISRCGRPIEDKVETRSQPVRAMVRTMVYPTRRYGPVVAHFITLSPTPTADDLTFSDLLIQTTGGNRDVSAATPDDRKLIVDILPCLVPAATPVPTTVTSPAERPASPDAQAQQTNVYEGQVLPDSGYLTITRTEVHQGYKVGMPPWILIMGRIYDLKTKGNVVDTGIFLRCMTDRKDCVKLDPGTYIFSILKNDAREYPCEQVSIVIESPRYLGHPVFCSPSTVLRTACSSRRVF